MKKWLRTIPLLLVFIPMHSQPVFADRLFNQIERTTAPGVGQLLLSVGIICAIMVLFGLQQRRAQKQEELAKDELYGIKVS
ncbi:hypothetical protein [Rubeoparvulum massiliense]|uniref:hypothetical protein n=1 Tax=Rubeoparvulum massiliense TaxID=1631346 RepID=UPI00065DEB51|nr:hypothetical protein [Rubeoparvulum massiliense]